MSSLALQLFVNLNKLIGQYSEAGLGSGYARQLVERVKVLHPELLSCSDPDNAHTAALTAFVLGIALRELRSQGGSQFTVHTVGQMLKDALDSADEHLERLAPAEVHLVLQAHEEHKTYMGVRDDLVSPGHELGRARGVDDILPVATTMAPVDLSTPHKGSSGVIPKITPTLQASSIDVGPMDIPDIQEATTGAESFLTSTTQLAALSSGHGVSGECDDVLVGAVDYGDGPTSSAHTNAAIDMMPGDATVAFGLDRAGRQEFVMGGDEMQRESADPILARHQQREQELGGGVDGPGRRLARPAHTNNGTLPKGSVFSESEWISESSSPGGTFLHSESAPDNTGVRAKPAKRVSPVAWAAPTFLVLPPVGLFYSGVLWGRGAWASSLATLALSLVGAAGLVAWWMLRG